jgi:transposase
MPAACREHPPSAATPGDYDAGKKISGRKTFGVVDTLGLLLRVFVVPVSVSDNIGGIAVIDDAAPKTSRLAKLWVDTGFKNTFINHCAATHNLVVEVVSRTTAHQFQILPRRWVVERTWGWLVNHRRLRIDYERDPVVTAGLRSTSIRRSPGAVGHLTWR